MLPNFLHLLYHWPCSKCPNFRIRIYFSSSVFAKKTTFISERISFFPFLYARLKKFFIVSPLISSFSPPFVLHALLSFRSFHFYPQMTFYVPSVASLTHSFSFSIILQSHIHTKRKLVGWSLLIRFENGFGRIWIRIALEGLE